MDSSLVAVPHGGGWHIRITAVERLGFCLSPSTIPACTWNRDALGLVAGVAFPPAVGPKDGIGRFREGIRRPKVAAAFQADPQENGVTSRSIPAIHALDGPYPPVRSSDPRPFRLLPAVC